MFGNNSFYIILFCKRMINYCEKTLSDIRLIIFSTILLNFLVSCDFYSTYYSKFLVIRFITYLNIDLEFALENRLICCLRLDSTSFHVAGKRYLSSLEFRLLGRFSIWMALQLAFCGMFFVDKHLRVVKVYGMFKFP